MVLLKIGLPLSCKSSCRHATARIFRAEFSVGRRHDRHRDAHVETRRDDGVRLNQ